MVMVVVDDSCLQQADSQPKWLHHMNGVNSRNDLGHGDRQQYRRGYYYYYY